MHDQRLHPARDSDIATRANASHTGTNWLRPLLGMLSPSGLRGRLTILIFHRVHERPDSMFPNEMHATAFRERMTWVSSWFNVLPLDEAVSALAHGSLPARALAITFDDGYADNFTVAVPILRQLGLHATFFIAAGFSDGTRMWNDTLIEVIRSASGPDLDLSGIGLGRHAVDSARARNLAFYAIVRQIRYLPPAQRQERVDAIESMAASALPRNLMMTGEQIRQVSSEMGIGGHTVSHPILTRLDDAAARREIADGRDLLEALIRQPVKLFAYPNGKPGTDYTSAHVRMVKELGFVAALSTAHGASRVGDSPYELPRYTPWGGASAAWGWRLMQNLGTNVQRTST